MGFFRAAAAGAQRDHLRPGSGSAGDQPVTLAGPNRSDRSHAALCTRRPAAHRPSRVAQTTDCRVIGIADGNVFSCRTAEGDRLRVRMAEIDAPELKQPYGAQARQALSGYVFGKDVQLAVRVATTGANPGSRQGPGHRRQRRDGPHRHCLGISCSTEGPHPARSRGGRPGVQAGPLGVAQDRTATAMGMAQGNAQRQALDNPHSQTGVTRRLSPAARSATVTGGRAVAPDALA